MEMEFVIHYFFSQISNVCLCFTWYNRSDSSRGPNDQFYNAATLECLVTDTRCDPNRSHRTNTRPTCHCALVNGKCLLVVFYIPSTERSFRDGIPIYCPLRRTQNSFLHHSHQELNPRPSLGSPLHDRCATPAPLAYMSSSVGCHNYLVFKHQGLTQLWNNL